MHTVLTNKTDLQPVSKPVEQEVVFFRMLKVKVAVIASNFLKTGMRLLDLGNVSQEIKLLQKLINGPYHFEW